MRKDAQRPPVDISFPLAWVVGLLAMAGARPGAVAQSPSPVAALERVAQVEDGRGRRGLPLEELRVLARHPDAGVRGAAVRAMGRQQSAAWVSDISAGMRDPSPVVRREAINAMGQALTAFRAPLPGAASVLGTAVGTLEVFGRSATPQERGVIARTLGRLPYPDSALARRAERVILGLASGLRMPADAAGALHGLYGLARARRTLGDLSPAAVEWMRSQVVRGEPDAAEVRRLAMLGLTAAGALDAGVIARARTDRDDQVRRLAVVGSTALPAADRVALLREGARDPAAMVRFEAVRGWRPLAGSEGCGFLIEAVGDAHPTVSLAAIDGMSAQCRDRARVADTLLSLIDSHRTDSPVRAPGRAGWQVHAHALLALARTDPERARPVVRREVQQLSFWGVRWYAARAAAVLTDTATLRTLAGPGHGNVREAALGGLVQAVGHGADDALLAALDAAEYHVIAEAAQGLKGTPDAPRASAALLRTLTRLTAEQRENNRDPRIAILDRLEELGTPSAADALGPLVTDYDSTVARRAAALVTRWTGRQVEAAPRLQAAPVETLRPLLRGEWRARVVMSAQTGGGSFEVRLLPREAPFTVARFVRLARAGHYNGLTFHRVEPGFVIQGGSPAANEFVGDGPFMRDEVALRSHTRGTLGISTRGRDTGDAQLFVNLTDNFRLDHDYTVFGEIVRGRDVAESVLEADVIERIEILPPR